MYFHAALGRGVEDFLLLEFSVLLVVEVVEVVKVVMGSCRVEDEDDDDLFFLLVSNLEGSNLGQSG